MSPLKKTRKNEDQSTSGSRADERHSGALGTFREAIGMNDNGPVIPQLGGPKSPRWSVGLGKEGRMDTREG